MPEPYAALAAQHGATLPSADLNDLIARRSRRATPAGTSDALLGEGRAERAASVAGVYLDTSVPARVVLDEPDSDAIGPALDGSDAVVSSRRLRIELHRLGLRAEIPRKEIDAWLAGVALVPMDDAILAAAEAVSPASVATLDAMHLATALRLAAEGHIASIMTFDVRLADGAREHEMDVIAPA